MKRFAVLLCVTLASLALATPPTAHAAREYGDVAVQITPTSTAVVRSSGQSTSDWVDAEVGRHGRPGRPYVARTFYAFDLSGLDPADITEVVLAQDLVHSPGRDCTPRAEGPAVLVLTSRALTGAAAWPGPDATSAATADSFAVGDQRACVNRSTRVWNLTDQVRAAAADSSTVTLRVASEDEGNEAGYRRYAVALDGNYADRPVLTVYLRPQPNQPTDLTLARTTPVAQQPPATWSEAASFSFVVSTPYGCYGGPYPYCLSARLTISDGGKQLWEGSVRNPTFLTATSGRLSINTSLLLEEGVTYTATAWTINDYTGLVSEPTSFDFTYHAPPAPPTVTAPAEVDLGQAIDIAVSHTDPSVRTFCWEGTSLVAAGCVDLGSNSGTVHLPGMNDWGYLDLRFYVIDPHGVRGGGASATVFVRPW